MSENEPRLPHYANVMYDYVEWPEVNKLLATQRAPPALVSFLIGFFFVVVTLFAFQYRFRNNLRVLRENYNLGKGVWEGTFTRTFLAALMDNDDPTYTVMSNMAIQFLFLGGFQLHYTMTYEILMLFYMIVAFGDIVRIVLSYREYDSLRDLVVTYKVRNKTDSDLGDMSSDDEDAKESLQKFNAAIVDYSPDNVYQNLAINPGLMLVIFVSQCVLISVVIMDALMKTRVPCFETPEKDCPTVGTLGSWFLFIVGTLVQNTYLMGPSGGFGKSQQNPAFWLVALLAGKQTGKGMIATWKSNRGLSSFNIESIERKEFKKLDIRLIIRLAMDTIINGFGYRVLLQSLPILLASRPSAMLVIFVAIGVLYIVKLDDSRGDHDIVIKEERHVEDEDADGNVIVFSRGMAVMERQENIVVGLIMNNIYKEKKVV